MPETPDGRLSQGSTLLDRYRIQCIVGMGDAGAVYQARDLNFPSVVKLCAIKELIVSAEDQQTHELMMNLFTREAEVLAMVEHPAVPKVFNYFSLGDRNYMVMEFIQGRDLETILNSTDRLIPVEQVCEWSISLCDILSYLHNHEPEPIVFRDMKPSHVMIDSRRAVRLVGFRWAKTFHLETPGAIVGTEGYAPPEQSRGFAVPQSDIYALGATIHHLLTRTDPRREPPFSFDQRPIQQFNPDVSDEFAAVIERALAYDPSERFATAEEMGQALETL